MNKVNALIITTIKEVLAPNLLVKTAIQIINTLIAAKVNTVLR